jgi:hypothetical protein
MTAGRARSPRWPSRRSKGRGPLLGDSLWEGESPWEQQLAACWRSVTTVVNQPCCLIDFFVEICAL